MSAAGIASAHGHGRFGIGFGYPIAAPMFVAPPPVYYVQPQVVYVTPAPVYYQQPVTVYRPAPVVMEERIERREVVPAAPPPEPAGPPPRAYRN